MKRLIFLAPSLGQAETVVEGLRALDIDDNWMHIVAKDHHMLEQAHLHEATDLETTEMATDLDWGMVAGGTLGMLAGLSAIGLGPLGLVLGGGTVLAGSLLGIGLGGWLGKMIGEQTPRAELEKYSHAIEQGQLLMMIDIPELKLPAVFRLIREHCPQALIESATLTHDRQIAA
ncbi:hypothetical protein [Marinobacterium arenosum]|uniref:hypothetical protein n=1 Tax=Marinobacterium arenosum TaxID=2862496 RepID=UPI001C94A4D4|nr:hypothetical protein [Marinobacterium arenosum]MBY4676283.1 hypothetical protein [Marinobacterium arenosum]